MVHGCTMSGPRVGFRTEFEIGLNPIRIEISTRFSLGSSETPNSRHRRWNGTLNLYILYWHDLTSCGTRANSDASRSGHLSRSDPHGFAWQREKRRKKGTERREEGHE